MGLIYLSISGRYLTSFFLMVGYCRRRCCCGYWYIMNFALGISAKIGLCHHMTLNLQCYALLSHIRV